MKRLCKHLILFAAGGCIYYLIEMLFRGYSHWTMMVLGGICFVLIGKINESFFTERMPLLRQGIIGACIVTALEFVSGLILNVWLGLDIWDYSNQPYNVMGQICLLFSMLWILLSIVAVVVDDWLRYILFGEERPHYVFF